MATMKRRRGSLGIVVLMFLPAGPALGAWPAGPSPQVVVGPEDRSPSADPSVGRLRKARKGNYLFCTATLIGRNCAVTAGHCIMVSEVIEFDLEIVPNRFTYARPEATFEIDRAHIVRRNDGKGRDWAVLPLRPNKKTGRRAGDERPPYLLAQQLPPIGGPLVMTGYGAADNLYSFSQQTSQGSVKAVVDADPAAVYLEHDVDSGNGSSGSALRDGETGAIVAIHTHGDSDRLVNSGTVVFGNQDLQAAIASCEDGAEQRAGGE